VNFWEATFRHIYTRRPVQQMGDLAGLKIRVIPNPSFIALFRVLGAAPTPMAFGEIYTALQQGVIDGAENDSVTYLTSRHVEVAKNLAITNHMMLVNAFVMSERQFGRLSAEQQGWIRDASLVGRSAMLAERTAREASAVADIARAGATITRPNLEPFIAAGRRTYEQSEERLGRDLVARFAAAARV
jgi:TRAP-type C4-dicarboxylate transport system substrate-binding protein